MRSLLVVCVLAGCGGGYDAQPRIADYECYSFGCPIAAGSEVLADPVYQSDITERVIVTDVAVTPPELADVRLQNNVIVLHAHAPSGNLPSATTDGSGTLSFTADNGDVYSRPISVQPIATSTVVPYEYAFPYDTTLDRLFTGGHIAMFTGVAMTVVVQHRDASGQRLLGHGFEPWTLEGAAELTELTETVPDEYDVTDYSLMRRLTAAGPGELRITAGGAPLILDVVPPRSTRRLEVDSFGRPISTLLLTRNQFTDLAVLAFGANDLFIAGGTVAATSSNPSVVKISRTTRGNVWLETGQPGTATISLELDGVTATVEVTVQ